MKKGWKRLILVAGCLLLGCLLGYFVTVTQAGGRMTRPILPFFAGQGLPVPEPAEPESNIISAGLLLGGIPQGLILYQHIADKWRIHAGRRLLLGIIAFPIAPAPCAWGGPFLVIPGHGRLFWKDLSRADQDHGAGMEVTTEGL